jgi:DNA-binding transcriptional MerR regulator
VTEPAATTLGPRELAALTGVSTDTLHHYERKGLLEPPPRTSGGYRRYPASSVGRVQLIRRALTIGFSLDELGRVLDVRRRGGTPCQEAGSLVGERLEDLQRQLADLRTLERDLQALLKNWDSRLARTPMGRRAHLLEMLADRPQLTRRPTVGGAPGGKGRRK